MPSLTITLKQQTPIIHFQANEARANLRATEVKPKLDQFLLAVARDKIDVGWKISSDTDALAYKMRIDTAPDESIAVSPVGNRLKGTLYFNPTGKDAEKRSEVEHGYVFCKRPFDVTLLSQHDGLLKLIKEHIYAFFILHNFGFRSSKGFGSYIVEKINGSPVPVTNMRYAAELQSMPDFRNVAYKMAMTGHSGEGRKKTWLEISKDIAKFYMPLKAHYLSEQYIPQMLEAENEREFIKAHFSNVQYFYREVAKTYGETWTAPTIRSNPPGYRYYRALLGLADHFEFYASGVSAKAKINVKDSRVDCEGPENDQAIVRFESPVFIKPYMVSGEWNVLIFLKRIPTEMYNVEFTFSDGDDQSNRDTPATIRTPFETEFDLYAFFEHYRKKTSKNIAGYTPIEQIIKGGGNS